MSGSFAAVVTGDVNASSRMSAGDARSLQGLLKRCFAETVAALPQADPRGFTGFRGDAWQFVIGEPEFAFRATLYFRGRLLVRGDEKFGQRLHTAASIGFGTIAYLPDKTTSSGGGEAYENSGRRLDRLRRRMPGMGAAGAGDLDGCLDNLLGLIDAIIRQWTTPRARAVTMALRGLSQVEIARRWRPRISQQAIQKHLAAAGWPALEPTLKWLETTMRSCKWQYNP